MKKLELNQLELVNGGDFDCGTGMGTAAGMLVGGLLLMASGPIGWGAALYLAGGATMWGNGVFNC